MKLDILQNKFAWIDDRNDKQGRILKFAIKVFKLYQNNQSVWIGENQTINIIPNT